MNRHYECLVCGSKHIHLDENDYYVCDDCGATYSDSDILRCDFCDSDFLEENAHIDKEGYKYCSEECRDMANGYLNNNY